MSEAAAAAPLARLLHAVEAVAAALDDEATAIAAGQPEPLLRAVQAKSTSLRNLEQLSREPRIRDMLGGDAADRELGELMDRLRACEQRNLATGSAIVMARRDNELLLRALGQQLQPAAYTSSGDAPATAGVRTLGKA
jgi:flagellar biosynthesis/type III secretory pathway chaperone